MRVQATTAAGTADITQMLTSYNWSGTKKRLARSMELSQVTAEADPALPRLDLPNGTAVALLRDDGTRCFSGYVVKRSRSSDSHVITYTCLDRGMYVAGNEGWYRFSRVTPEAAARRVCADFGIPVGRLTATGVEVSRKFAGVSLHQIVAAMYTKAAEQTGRRYHLCMEDEAFSVLERPGTASVTLAPKVNIMASSIAESIESLRNSVAIYSDQGALVRTIDDGESVKLYGLLQHALIQRRGGDAAAEARAYLEDNGVQQTVTVDCLGDDRLVTGGAVLVRQTGAGVAGLFWIDADSHQWKNGQHVTKLTLNFRNLMDKSKAGTEE